MEISEEKNKMIESYKEKCRLACQDVTPGLVQKLMLRDGFNVELDEIKLVMRNSYY
jgi:hypothetical protein